MYYIWKIHKSIELENTIYNLMITSVILIAKVISLIIGLSPNYNEIFRYDIYPMLYTLHITKYFLDQTAWYETRVVSELYYYIHLLPKIYYIHRFDFYQKNIHRFCLKKLIVRYILPILIIIHRYVSVGISIAVSPYEPVTSYISGRFFALHNKYEMLKSLPSYTEYHRRLNLATGFYSLKYFWLVLSTNE